ncbi:hypothetical protein SAMN05421666_1141 [Roseovarius nanhaiticus]|uniref:PRTase-CE domain-containing protein n=1 Tax=Roseovarius nanhaiticus TaxID=573024 RepID=A0A1N7FL47_9RHOB|nr:hypothetical protein [Roseovarius nanhaiticus]SEK51944.1 hypothetical protein SAMN05216208_0995 [Roseovarius nanhaiticus]SIS01010.1 hypothetical protein SAMN05421666_1141 [Roseovarius nanhaiticus]
MTRIKSIPEGWDFPYDGSPLPSQSVSMIDFLSKKVFNDYEPSQFQPFRLRLIDWLNNVDTEEEQHHLLALLLSVFFVGRREFEALYRTAYHGNIFRWVLADEDLDVFSDELESTVTGRINKSWICPISDSLRVNSFLKVNGLKSLDKRPDWRSLKQFGDLEKIRSYVEKKKISDLVLLEDFVGSGTQAKAAIKFAATTLPNTRILLCPLIVCPVGDKTLAEEAEKFENVTYDPVLVLPETAFHTYSDDAAENETPIHKFLCGLNEKLEGDTEKFMFGFMNTGAKVVMYSNCPNNTLPIFHHETENWKPLFPRVNRQ